MELHVNRLLRLSTPRVWFEHADQEKGTVLFSSNILATMQTKFLFGMKEDGPMRESRMVTGLRVDQWHVTTASGLGARLADILELPHHSKGEHINTHANLSHPTSSPTTRPPL